MVTEAMASLSDGELGAAEKLHQEMLATTDVAQWTDANLAFHAALWESQAQTRLARLVETMRDSSGPYISLSLHVSPDHIARSNIEHAQLLTHYKNRDVDQAILQTIEHLDGTLRIIVHSIGKA